MNTREGPPTVGLADLIVESTTPTDWTIEGIYPTAEAVLFYGPSHSGKTYVLLDQGLAVAYGRPWLGRFAVPKARPVLYCPSEGRRGIGKRVRAAVEHHYPYEGVGDFNLFDQPLDLTSDDSMRNLARAVEHHEPGLVIVDVLRDSTPGIEENSAAMGDAFGRLRNLAHWSGATVIVAHHAGKDLSKGARGHSSLKDKADQEVAVSAREPLRNGDGSILATAISLDNRKNRSEENWGRITLDLRRPSADLLAPVIVGEWGESDPRTTNPAGLAVLEAVVALAATTNRPPTEGGWRLAEIAEEVGKSKPAIEKTVKALAEQGFLALDTSGPAHLVTLTPQGLRATTNHHQPTKVGAARPPTNLQHPMGAAGVGGDVPPTIIEQLLDVERQEAPEGDDVPDDTGPIPDNVVELLFGEKGLAS